MTPGKISIILLKAGTEASAFSQIRRGWEVTASSDLCALSLTHTYAWVRRASWRLASALLSGWAMFLSSDNMLLVVKTYVVTPMASIAATSRIALKLNIDGCFKSD